MPPKKYTLGQTAGLHDLTLPSGATCQARRPGPQALIAAGVMDTVDDLRPFLDRGDDEESRAETVQMLMRDKEKLSTTFHVIDQFVATVVTQPAVWVDYKLPNESDEDFAKRKAEADDAVPVSAIDQDDKMFLVAWAAGNRES